MSTYLDAVDALVAERVLGWTNNWDTPGHGGMWGITDWHETEDGRRTPVQAADFPAYSSVIAVGPVADTPALAICLLALQICGVEVPK